jgi:hypothetical protein
MTSSARASSDWGSSRPSALAVLRLATRLDLIGACTSNSAGFFAPVFRLRSETPICRSEDRGTQALLPLEALMSLVIDAHQHFWTYGTYQTSWMGVSPYAGDPAFEPLGVRSSRMTSFPNSKQLASTAP